jgi:serine/threonine protein kinase
VFRGSSHGGQKLAIKVIKTTKDRNFLEKEKMAGKLLRHPGVVKLVDCYETITKYYLSFEYIEGLNLLQYLEEIHSITGIC